jgi:hypothetical protein
VVTNSLIKKKKARNKPGDKGVKALRLQPRGLAFGYAPYTVSDI